jgi:hypothetical protein
VTNLSGAIPRIFSAAASRLGGSPIGSKVS